MSGFDSMLQIFNAGSEVSALTSHMGPRQELVIERNGAVSQPIVGPLVLCTCMMKCISTVSTHLNPGLAMLDC